MATERQRRRPQTLPPTDHLICQLSALAQPKGTPVTDTTPHPEDTCTRCLGPNISWAAPSPLWNQVMRGGDISGQEIHEGIVCPVCFADLAEQAGIASLWRFYAERVNVPLQTITPSGRVWNSERWMWDEPEDVAAYDPVPGGGEPHAKPEPELAWFDQANGRIWVKSGDKYYLTGWAHGISELDTDRLTPLTGTPVEAGKSYVITGGYTVPVTPADETEPVLPGDIGPND